MRSQQLPQTVLCLRVGVGTAGRQHLQADELGAWPLALFVKPVGVDKARRIVVGLIQNALYEGVFVGHVGIRKGGLEPRSNQVHQVQIRSGDGSSPDRLPDFRQLHHDHIVGHSASSGALWSGCCRWAFPADRLRGPQR
jgi:hypothetical protein